MTLSIVIPAFNEAAGIRAVVGRICGDYPDAELLVVDDGSTDGTSDQLHDLPVRVLRHPHNIGNGASVKTGIRKAHGDYILLLDADGQHRPEDVGALLHEAGFYDLVVGARVKSSHQNAARALGNGALEAMASYLSGTPIPDLTSGFRVFRREYILEFVHLLPNRYSYPTTSTLAFLKAGYAVKFVPIEARKRQGGASGQKLLRNGIVFVTIILRMVTLFSPLKIFAPIAAVLFTLGATYGIWTAFTQHHITNSTGARLPDERSDLSAGADLRADRRPALRARGTRPRIPAPSAGGAAMSGRGGGNAKAQRRKDAKGIGETNLSSLVLPPLRLCAFASLRPRSGMKRALRRWLPRVVGIALSVAAVAKVGQKAVWGTLAHANGWLVLLAAVAVFPLLAPKARRWQGVLADFGIALPWRDAFRFYAIGLWAAIATPGQVGDGLKAWYVRGRGGHLAPALASVVVDRLFDLLLLLLAAAFGIVVYGGGTAAVAVPLLTLAVVAGIAVAAMPRLRSRLARLLPGSVRVRKSRGIAGRSPCATRT